MATSGAWQERIASKVAGPTSSEGSKSMSELGSIPELPIVRPRRRSLFGPLHEPLFRTLWIAAVVSYTGTWMQNVGAGWLMTSLTMSPLMVGLVQAAGSIAVFLVVLPAGAIADVVDRRKLLLFTQTWMVVAAAGLGVLTIAGKVTPSLLLLFALLMGFGAVLNDPAWQAITPEIVSHQNFAAGIALNSAGFNVARSIGPALGGLVIAAAGSGIAFLLNALSFFGVIYFLYLWKRKPGRTSMRLGHMFTAMFEGFRYLRASSPMKAVLGATVLAFFRRRLSADALVSLATAVFALATFAAGRWQTFPVLSVTMLIAGIAWIQILASLNVSAQTMSPGHMRARAISMYLLVLQGGLAGGAALWGEIAERVGMAHSLSYAAIGLGIGMLATFWFRLRSVEIHPNALAMN